MNDIRLGLPSASSAQADVLCPGRPNAQRGIPEWQKNEYAKFGQLVHLAYEGDDLAAMQLSAEQTEIVRKAVVVEQAVLAAWSTGTTKRLKEERLWDYDAEGKERNSGQFDVCHLEPTRALVGDLKSLYGDIPTATKNRQLREQAALVYLNREKLGVPKLKEVSVFINQPLVSMKPPVVKYGKADLERAVAEMRARVDKNMDPDAPRVAGAYQCGMCRAALLCPVAAEFVTRLKGVNVLDLQPEALADMLERFEVLAAMDKQAREYAKLLLTNVPGSVPGWILEEGNVMRTITNYRGAVDTLIATGFTTEQVDSISDLSIKAAAGLIFEKNKDTEGMTKTKSELEAKDLLKPWTTESQNQPSLKRVKE